MRMRLLFLAAVLVFLPAVAGARTVEPGTITGAVAVGPGFKYGSILGGSGGYLLIQARGDYAIDQTLSVVADLMLGNFGFIGTVPLKLRAGGRYRLTGLDLPISPYGQAQLSVGRLFDVIGANLTTFGLFLGVGADYFLTAQLGTGLLVGTDLSRAFSDRSAFIGTFEITVYASYAF
jgi:hypothetical protein